MTQRSEFLLWLFGAPSIGVILLKITSAVAAPTPTHDNDNGTCLDPMTKCLSDGSLGVCCGNEGFCFQPMGLGRRDSGYCIVKNCLDNGKSCHRSGSMGFCCSGHCDHFMGEDFGECMDGNSTRRRVPVNMSEEDVTPPPSQAPGPVDLAPVYGLIALVLVVVTFGGVTLWVRGRKTRTGTQDRDWSQKSDSDTYIAGSEIQKLGSDALFPATYARLKAVIGSKPYKEYEVPEQDFSVDTDSILGKGAFSIVLKAIVRGREVAAKTVSEQFSIRDGSSVEAQLEPLLQELKIRIDVGPHDNIVSLVGAHTQRLIYGVCYVFVELCANGSVLDYINSNSCQHDFVEGSGALRRDPVTGYLLPPLNGRESGGILSGLHLVNWCMDIAAGMSHLASLGIVHGDLAARNVLLTDGMVAKISDFGLSKKLYNTYNKYVTGSKEAKVPWQHMAPESLTRLKFSTPSDVWAFGVTMWEMYSLGDLAYAPLEWTPDFVKRLTERGERLQKPMYATDEVYALMLQCWALEPDRRPSFDEIHASLAMIRAHIQN